MTLHDKSWSGRWQVAHESLVTYDIPSSSWPVTMRRGVNPAIMAAASSVGQRKTCGKAKFEIMVPVNHIASTQQRMHATCVMRPMIAYLKAAPPY